MKKSLFTTEELAELAIFDADVDASPLTLQEAAECNERDREIMMANAKRRQRAAYNKRYRDTHKAEIAALKRRYSATHKEEIKRKKHEYYLANKELFAERARRYYQAIKEKRRNDNATI